MRSQFGSLTVVHGHECTKRFARSSSCTVNRETTWRMTTTQVEDSKPAIYSAPVHDTC